MQAIILASQSPRRARLLKCLGLKFKVVKSGFVEDASLFISPMELVQTLALGKAEKVAKKFPYAVVIAADTIVVLGREVLGKPRNRKEAKAMLKKLSGRRHMVLTGLAVLNLSKRKKFLSAAASEIVFRRLSSREIDNYVATGEPLDKAGAYAIQGRGRVLIESVRGDYTGIIGLPIAQLVKILKNLGYKI